MIRSVVPSLPWQKYVQQGCTVCGREGHPLTYRTDPPRFLCPVCAVKKEVWPDVPLQR